MANIDGPLTAEELEAVRLYGRDEENDEGNEDFTFCSLCGALPDDACGVTAGQTCPMADPAPPAAKTDH